MTVGLSCVGGSVFMCLFVFMCVSVCMYVCVCVCMCVYTGQTTVKQGLGLERVRVATVVPQRHPDLVPLTSPPTASTRV